MKPSLIGLSLIVAAFLPVSEAVAAGRMEPSTQMAQKLAGQLFPRQPLWCPMWDDLPA